MPGVGAGITSVNRNVFPILPPVLLTRISGSVPFLEFSFIPFLFIYKITELEHLETEVQRLALAAPEVSPGSLVHIMSDAIRSAPD